MIGSAGQMVRASRAAELGVKIVDPPRCAECGCGVRIESYVVLRPEYGVCESCGAVWEDTKPRGKLCRKCGFSEEEDAEGRGGCLPQAEPESRRAD